MTENRVLQSTRHPFLIVSFPIVSPLQLLTRHLAGIEILLHDPGQTVLCDGICKWRGTLLPSLQRQAVFRGWCFVLIPEMGFQNLNIQDRTKFYGAEIICAIEYLHKRGIIYRDLKVRHLHILVFRNLKINISSLRTSCWTRTATSRQQTLASVKRTSSGGKQQKHSAGLRSIWLPRSWRTTTTAGPWTGGESAW